jgi:hypothetical protein
MSTRLTRRRFGLSLVAAGLAGCRRRPTAADPHHDAEPRARERVRVDVARVVGPFDRLSGAQGSPAAIVDGEPELVRQFQAASIGRTRFPQDCEPNTLTLAGIFPDDAADPESASSYHFEAIDRHVRAARAAGARVLWQASYDVGRSDHWKGLNLGGRPPADLRRWTKVVARCLDHFAAGWANGFDGAVDAVEFINEPDGLGGFNGADAKRLSQAFIDFLDTIEAWNRAHPAIAVRAVGPGIPLSFAEWPTWRPRFDAALGELKKSGKTLPVFSFHTYGDDVSPAANEKLARALRALLDAHAMTSTELWNTEWQAGDFLRQHLSIDAARATRAGDAERRRFTAAAASYAIACKLRWQGVVAGSCYYRANRRAFPPGRTPPQIDTRAGEGPFFHANGKLAGLGLQEVLLKRVAETTPERCPCEHGDDGLLTVTGLRSKDGSKVSVLVSNLDTRARDLDIHVVGAPRLARARVAVLDDREDLGFRPLAPPSTSAGDQVLAASIAPLGSTWLLLEG